MFFKRSLCDSCVTPAGGISQLHMPLVSDGNACIELVDVYTVELSNFGRVRQIAMCIPQ